MNKPDPETEPQSQHSHETGDPCVEIGPETTRFCQTCQDMVVPIDTGRCPTCKQFLPLNAAARKADPESRGLVAALHRQIVEEFRPADVVSRSQCMELARVTARIERSKNHGSLEYQRLTETQRGLRDDMLKGAKPFDLDAAVRDVEKLSPSQLADRAEEIARDLRELADRAARPVPLMPEFLADQSPDDAQIAVPGPTSPVFSDACEFCHRSPCIGEGHPQFHILHFGDPQHVAERDEIARLEMIESMRRSRR